MLIVVLYRLALPFVKFKRHSSKNFHIWRERDPTLNPETPMPIDIHHAPTNLFIHSLYIDI